MTQFAQLCVTLFANAQNAKSIAKRLNVLSARSTVISHNVTFVAQRIYAKRRIAQSAKLFALQPTVVLNVKLLMLSVLLCVKLPSVTGNVRSQSLALSQSVNSYANALLVILVPVRKVLREVAAHVLIKLT
jgi:hypothetical protein